VPGEKKDSGPSPTLGSALRGDSTGEDRTVLCVWCVVCACFIVTNTVKTVLFIYLFLSHAHFLPLILSLSLSLSLTHTQPMHGGLIISACRCSWT
jgi:hypothetical protein